MKRPMPPWAGITMVGITGLVTVMQAQAPGPVGVPLRGLTVKQIAQFEAGKEDFEELETAKDGLGPVFNGISRGSCHNLPVTVKGGAGHGRGGECPGTAGGPEAGRAVCGAGPALHQMEVVAYSDFLLHNVGTGDGVEQGMARGNEFRTPPLWGMRFRKMLLHDGRALTPEEAIEAHRGEAGPVRGGSRRFRSRTGRRWWRF